MPLEAAEAEIKHWLINCAGFNKMLALLLVTPPGKPRHTLFPVFSLLQFNFKGSLSPVECSRQQKERLM